MTHEFFTRTGLKLVRDTDPDAAYLCRVYGRQEREWLAYMETRDHG